MEAGLTQYEARAYLVLRDLGTARVTELARASGVPRNKLYGALTGLERFGLAEVRGDAPLTYGSRPLAPFVRSRIARLEDLLKLSDATASVASSPVTR